MTIHCLLTIHMTLPQILFGDDEALSLFCGPLTHHGIRVSIWWICCVDEDAKSNKKDDIRLYKIKHIVDLLCQTIKH